MSLEVWQLALRRQYGREQAFVLKKLGGHPIFSEFEVENPRSRTSYRVVIRGSAPGSNFCACPDLATNSLGTCKHIEFVLGWLERRPRARAALARGFTPPFTELYVAYGARREVRFRPRADAPPALGRLAARYFDPDGTLRADAFGRFEEFLAAAARLDPELRCYEDVLSLVAQVRDAERRAAVLAEAFPRGARSDGFKGLLRVAPYPYQREAALFAARAGRCLIGDEMGLGKTIEAIAAAEIMARHFGVERVLVVCPTSLKHQWEREIARVVARPVRVIGGFRRNREAGFRAVSFYKITQHANVVVHVDLPWNPAVLEQRIGRVHRLGQTRPVQVVSFVAKGTIEEGMLAVLGFKRSLFAGVLDGGEREVFLGGSRLTRFMEGVERVTGQIPDPLVEEASGEDGSAPARGAGRDAGDGTSEPGGDARPGLPDPLAALLRTGLEVLSRLAAGPDAAPATGGAARPPALERVRDERTGEHYLKLRMPPPEVLDRITGALGALLDSLRA